MRHRIRLLYVVAAAFVIAASGLMIINRLDQDIAVMREGGYSLPSLVNILYPSFPQPSSVWQAFG